jgi:hypothetical protein
MTLPELASEHRALSQIVLPRLVELTNEAETGRLAREFFDKRIEELASRGAAGGADTETLVEFGRNIADLTVSYVTECQTETLGQVKALVGIVAQLAGVIDRVISTR